MSTSTQQEHEEDVDLATLLKQIEEIKITGRSVDNLNETLRQLVAQENQLTNLIKKKKAEGPGAPGSHPTLVELESAFAQVVLKISRVVSAIGEITGSPHHVKKTGPPEIPAHEIIFDPVKDYLGGGAYGKVYKGYCRGKNVAIKIPVKQVLTEAELKSFRNEVEIMRNIFHPNVVLFLGACTEPNKIMIVTELMKTDVERLLKNNHDAGKITVYQRIKMAKDAALGVNWLHGICKIIHRDLKSANLLVDGNMTVKVTDFGFAENIKSDRHLLDKKGPKGTALYMAPEVMKQEEFNEKADIYSFGLILWEILTGQELFPEYEDLDPFYQAICFNNERPIIPPGTLPSIAALMKRCWDADAKARPNFEQIIRDLDNILIECAIQDVSAREFWKTYFLRPKGNLQEEVPWLDFVAQLSHAANTPIDRDMQHKLAKIIPVLNSGHDSTPIVTMDRLQLLTSWFGPFFIPAHAAKLKEMGALIQKPWFHNTISKDVSERRLRSRSDNTFLVRLSLNDPAATPFTISRVKGGKPTHKRITRLPNGQLSVPVENHTLEFPDLISMIDKLKAIKNVGADCPHTEINNPYIND
eukprot:TRINITY_DN6119_c0_g1_i1.p1 TRINITY_DN6119_c0_g1~~TRINITY_DN6119_c0_g1_i1.p1  ORF type:complete len:585 (-),score=151.22 TRINITY_DN6119_c0_g1_i1:89-1843(-)